VVAGADQHLRVAQLRRLAAEDQAQLQGERLQPSQRAQRLGLAVDLVLQPGSEFGVVNVFDVMSLGMFHVSGKR
jgi:hypothetical protein